jgi:hypothetical protein
VGVSGVRGAVLSSDMELGTFVRILERGFPEMQRRSWTCVSLYTALRLRR